MSVIDIGAEIRAVLVELGLTADDLDKRIERAVLRALEKQSEKLEPLAAILGCSSKAASARMARDPELRRVGVQVGSRTLFTRSNIESYFRAKHEGHRR